MQFYLDSADFVEIQEAWGLGILSGVTTNPSLVAKTGEDFHDLIYRICTLVDPGNSGKGGEAKRTNGGGGTNDSGDTDNARDTNYARDIGDADGLDGQQASGIRVNTDRICVNAEVLALDVEGMVREGEALAAIHPNVVVKIPMIPTGLQAVKRLRRQGIPTNVTLVFTPIQALLAARAGASFVSPFLGRLDDIGEDGVAALSGICDVFAQYDIACQIIAASIRHPVHVLQAAQVGADIATIPFKVLKQLYEHPLTKRGIERFSEDWAKGKE